MEFKITILCDNTVTTSKLQLGEHGLSMLIESGEDKVLFDTGQTNIFVLNSRILGKNLSKVNKVVLSHGHYDHTGGLGELMGINKNFELFAHPLVFYPPKYVIREKTEIYIGPIIGEERLLKEGIKVNLNKEPTKINEYIMTTGEIPRKNEFELPEKDLLIKEGEEFKQDPLLDDISLILKTDKGIVVLLGCAHSGVINILNKVREITKTDDIFAVIGGMHLGKKSREQIKIIIEKLKNFNIQMIAPSHCTGFLASKMLSDEFGERFFLNTVGKTINF